jgi:hypothetical protein
MNGVQPPSVPFWIVRNPTSSAAKTFRQLIVARAGVDCKMASTLGGVQNEQVTRGSIGDPDGICRLCAGGASAAALSKKDITRLDDFGQRPSTIGRSRNPRFYWILDDLDDLDDQFPLFPHVTSRLPLDRKPSRVMAYLLV